MSKQETKHTEGRLTPVTGQGAHHRDIYLRIGDKRSDGSWPAVAKCCSSTVGARVVVEANGALLAAAWNSYTKHFGTRAVEAAEADALGEAVELLRACRGELSTLCVHFGIVTHTTMVPKLTAFLTKVEGAKG